MSAPGRGREPGERNRHRAGRPGGGTAAPLCRSGIPVSVLRERRSHNLPWASSVSTWTLCRHERRVSAFAAGQWAHRREWLSCDGPFVQENGISTESTESHTEPDATEQLMTDF